MSWKVRYLLFKVKIQQFFCDHPTVKDKTCSICGKCIVGVER